MKVNYAALIRQSLDMGEVTQYYGLQFNRAGFSLCPFHAEKTPSFKVKDSQYAHCFGCGWHGDAISFVMELLGLPFQAACERLNDDFRLGYPLTRKPTLREQRDAAARWREIRVKRERQEQAKQLYETMYRRLWDEYIRLDLQRMRYSPAAPSEDFDPLYVEAVKRIDYIEYLIDELL